MEISKGALGIVAAVCVVAGAGGVYVATRTGQAVPTPQAATATPAPNAPAGVEQSEGVVSDAAATTTTPDAPAAPVVAPRRAESEPAHPRESRAARKPAPERRAAAPAPQDAPALAPPALEPPPRVADSGPVQPPAPPEPQYYDLVIPADAVIGLQVETPVSSDTARVEDRVTARV